MPHALIVDDDLGFALPTSELIAREGFTTTLAGSLREAREQLACAPPDIVVLDMHLPDGLGIELLKDLELMPSTQTVMVTANGSVVLAVQAMRAGAVHFLTKPFDFAAIKTMLVSIEHARRLAEEIDSLRGELRGLGRFSKLVGASPAMQALYDLIEKVARTDATVLLLGETGTGKEVVAETIHALSRRRHRKFVAVNCGAVSTSLIESELFGHERGSFTGALRRHEGHFERAHEGTLLLDEVTEMSPDLQVKLLRVLENQVIQRVGAQDTLTVDVRVIAATNRVPREAVAEGKLRADLHFRLNVFPIQLPPLRDRGGDVELLAEHFLAGLNREEGASKRFSPAALQRLNTHSWPGNVRELKNVVQRAFILAEDVIAADLILVGDGATNVTTNVTTNGANGALDLHVGASLADIERVVILSRSSTAAVTRRPQARCSVSASRPCTTACASTRSLEAAAARQVVEPG